MVLKPAAFTELINCWVMSGLPQLVSPPTASNVFPTFQPIPINCVSSTLVTPELTELLELLELIERLEELLIQIPGCIAQYSSLQVCGGQSGQLLPCGQLSPELKDELLLELMDKLESDTLLDERDDKLTLDELILDGLTLDREDEPQIAPVTTGVSIAPFALTCIPKVMVCPGCKVLFQLKLDAL